MLEVESAVRLLLQSERGSQWMFREVGGGSDVTAASAIPGSQNDLKWNKQEESQHTDRQTDPDTDTHTDTLCFFYINCLYFKIKLIFIWCFLQNRKNKTTKLKIVNFSETPSVQGAHFFIITELSAEKLRSVCSDSVTVIQSTVIITTYTIRHNTVRSICLWQQIHDPA